MDLMDRLCVSFRGERDGAVRLQEAAEAREVTVGTALAELWQEHGASVAAAEAEQGSLQRSVALLEGEVRDFPPFPLLFYSILLQSTSILLLLKLHLTPIYLHFTPY